MNSIAKNDHFTLGIGNPDQEIHQNGTVSGRRWPWHRLDGVGGVPVHPSSRGPCRRAVMSLAAIGLLLWMPAAWGQQRLPEPRTVEERWARQADPLTINPLTPAQRVLTQEWVDSLLKLAMSQTMDFDQEFENLFGLKLEIVETQQVLQWAGGEMVSVVKEVKDWRRVRPGMPLAYDYSVYLRDETGENLGSAGLYPGPVERSIKWSMSIDKSQLCIQEGDIQQALGEGHPLTWTRNPLTLLSHHSWSPGDMEILRKRGGNVSELTGRGHFSKTDERLLSFIFLNWKCLLAVNMRAVFWKTQEGSTD